MPENVFQDDDRVINEPRECEGESPEDHRVNRTVAKRQGDEGGQRRKWNGQKYRSGGAKIPKENQNHQPGKNKTDRAFIQQVFNRAFDENGLIEDHFRDQKFRHIYKAGHRLFYPVNDRDRVRVAALFENGQINGALAINAHNTGLNLRSVCGVPDVAHEHGRAVHRFQR